MKDQLVDESMKYGIGMLVLVACVLGLCYAVKVLYDDNRETKKKLLEAYHDNTVAFQSLQSTISMLVSILKK